jgi:hypothetical protein
MEIAGDVTPRKAWPELAERWGSKSVQPSINHLSFQLHSGFVREFSTAVLCFHIDSGVVRSVLRNSFLDRERETSCPLCGEPIGGLFVALGTFSEVGSGRVGSSIAA